MEPRIQYAKTEDGVSIAYWTLGEGPPLVQMPLMAISHLQLEWETPEIRHYYERLAQRRRLIRYDSRGFGLSDRAATDYSSDALLLDVEAVAKHLGLDRFDLSGGWHLGPVAITYAARNPERLSHLILWSTWARASDYYKSAKVQTLGSLRDKDWEIYTETVSHALTGWTAGDAGHRFAALIRESVTQETLQTFVRASSQFDASPDLAQVRPPTLVLGRRQFEGVDHSLTTGLASEIPGAQLLLLEGDSLAPHLGDSESVLKAIDEFLGEGEEAPGAEAPEAGAFRTILFTDVEGSTALTQRLGDAKARDVLREHERIVREALKSHGGSEVKTMGDGFMTSFSSATRALECAIALQRAFAERNESAAEPINVRIGLNAGEPIAEDDDLFGASVNRAARIAAMAQGGEILVANVVRELAEGKEFMFGDRGETALRGFDDPVRLFEVRWRED